MSRQETERVVRQWYSALVKGDLKGIMDGLAEDIHWEIPRTEFNRMIPWAGVCNGRAQVAEAFRLRNEALTLEQFEPREFIFGEDRAVVIVFERSVCNHTGKRFVLDGIVQVLDVKNGKIAAWKAYYDPCPIIDAFREDPAQRLVEAVRKNDAAAVESLLAAKADPNARAPETGLTVLMMAACQANVKLVRLLLDAGADVLTTDSATGATALHKACQGGSADIAKMLVEKGAFIDAVTPTMGHTPVMDALWYKFPKLVKYLVDQGANLNLSTHYGFSMWDHLSFEQNVNTRDKDKMQEIADIFKRKVEEDKSTISGQTVMAATNKGDLAEVKKQISSGAGANTVYPHVNSFLDGHTPLLVAARDGHTDIVRELLKAGAKVRVADWVFKGAPIHKATYNGNAEILKMLVNQPGIDLDVQGAINGYTPLHDALWHGYTECVEILLEAGARLDLAGHDGKLPVDVAVDTFGEGHAVVKMIRERMK